MDISSAKLAFFSPTGTSKRVLKGIADGLAFDHMDFIDVTPPEARSNPLIVAQHELLVIAVPVYMGRVPALLYEWLNAIQARNTPAVCVVVYGNRAFENSLLELKDILFNRGCIPIAGAAYIGEHSFSKSDTPVASGRPDENDLVHAKEFGRKVQEKIRSADALSVSLVPEIPGSFPYGGVNQLWDVDFIAVNDDCIQCGVCADVCPMGAVDPNNSTVIDNKKCITCCACIKKCPQNARSMKQSPVQEAATRLYTLHREPKMPECYL